MIIKENLTKIMGVTVLQYIEKFEDDIEHLNLFEAIEVTFKYLNENGGLNIINNINDIIHLDFKDINELKEYVTNAFPNLSLDSTEFNAIVNMYISKYILDYNNIVFNERRMFLAMNAIDMFSKMVLFTSYIANTYDVTNVNIVLNGNVITNLVKAQKQYNIICKNMLDYISYVNTYDTMIDFNSESSKKMLDQLGLVEDYAGEDLNGVVVVLNFSMTENEIDQEFEKAGIFKKNVTVS